MADLVRRAGTGRFVDGTDVVWSVAEGQKGRRWREVRTRDGVVLSSLLLETFPDRRFAHLELTTAAGLLTLHPEADGTINGNVVRAAGIEHIAGVPWPAGALLIVHGSPTALAAAASSVRGGGAEPAEGERPIVAVDPSLGVRAASVPAAGLARHPIDADGLPILTAGSSWPLELEAR